MGPVFYGSDSLPVCRRHVSLPALDRLPLAIKYLGCFCFFPSDDGSTFSGRKFNDIQFMCFFRRETVRNFGQLLNFREECSFSRPLHAQLHVFSRRDFHTQIPYSRFRGEGIRFGQDEVDITLRMTQGNKLDRLPRVEYSSASLEKCTTLLVI